MEPLWFIGFLIFILAIIMPLSVKIVKQWSIWLVERLGRYHRTVESGISFLIPGFEKLKKVDVREQVINVPEQEVITADNVGVTVDGIVYVRIEDPFRATYEINQVYMAVVNLAQTNLRSVLGTMALDDTLSNREMINAKLLAQLDQETSKWWVKVTRVEIKRLDPPRDIQEAMSKQMKAEREKRAQILEAQGYKDALITKSEGDKKSAVLQAEWLQQAAVLKASWDAEATIKTAEAEAKKIELESNAAQQYFEGNAVKKEQLEVIRDSLSKNTKFVLDADILSAVGKAFWIK